MPKFPVHLITERLSNGKFPTPKSLEKTFKFAEFLKSVLIIWLNGWVNLALTVSSRLTAKIGCARFTQLIAIGFGC